MFSTTVNPHLPKLAWFATVDQDDRSVHVEHGASVEVGEDFAVEGVWDGDFDDTSFHRSGQFFGSGILRDEDGVWLVPSRALVDRIMYCVDGRRVHASNSLPLLLSRTGAEPDPDWDYRKETYTILRGVRDYEPEFRVLHPRIPSFRQAYYHPLRIDTSGIHVDDSRTLPELRSFSAYLEHLQGTLGRLRENYTSERRQHPMKGYTTVSTGYDSSAVTALVRSFGITAAFTSRRSNSSILPWMSKQAAIDDGTPIAQRFDLPVRYLERKPAQVGRDELLFLAATANDPELVFYRMGEAIEREAEAAVVFTGFHGDKVWDVETSDPYLGTDIRRGDTSGLNLGEMRLKAGFVNVAVPFIFSERIRELVEISRGAEMRPWSIGGDYDRPIPRRILEEAGVPREAFGMRKKAVLQSYNYPVNRQLRRDFFRWLKRKHGWSRWKVYAFEKLNIVLFLVSTALDRVLGKVGWSGSLSRRVFLGRDVDLPYELHLWALEQVRNDPSDSAPKAATDQT